VATWPQSNDFNTKETGCGAAHTLHFQDHFVLESESDFRIILGLENAAEADAEGVLSAQEQP
jgi:hypothetical protein